MSTGWWWWWAWRLALVAYAPCTLLGPHNMRSAQPVPGCRAQPIPVSHGPVSFGPTNRPTHARRCGLTLGVPLKPMLANACAGVADGLLQLQSASPAAVAVASAGAAAGGGTGGARAGAAAAMSTPPSAPPASSSSSSSWSPLVLPPFLVEYKYDGRRAQIHLLPDGRVRRAREGLDGDGFKALLYTMHSPCLSPAPAHTRAHTPMHR